MTLHELIDSAPNRHEILKSLGLSTRRGPLDDPLLAAGLIGAGIVVGAAVSALIGRRLVNSAERRRSGNGADVRRGEFGSVPAGV